MKLITKIFSLLDENDKFHFFALFGLIFPEEFLALIGTLKSAAPPGSTLHSFHTDACTSQFYKKVIDSLFVHFVVWCFGSSILYDNSDAVRAKVANQ